MTADACLKLLHYDNINMKDDTILKQLSHDSMKVTADKCLKYVQIDNIKMKKIHIGN